MSRLLYLLALGMMIYFLLKSFFLPPKKPAAKKEKTPAPGLNFQGEGEMVQDPVCGTYIDTATAPALTHQGRQHYFCSETCRDKFKTELGEKGSA